VAGATSGLPFTTLDTVGSDTPASAAIAARVVLRTASPFDLNLEIIEPLEGCGTAMFLLHRTAIKAT
jgi:hypothetical protein